MIRGGMKMTPIASEQIDRLATAVDRLASAVENLTLLRGCSPVNGCYNEPTTNDLVDEGAMSKRLHVSKKTLPPHMKAVDALGASESLTRFDLPNPHRFFSANRCITLTWSWT